MTPPPSSLLTTAETLHTPAPPPDRRVAYRPGPFRFGDLRVPAGEGPHPVAVLLHGGCWRDIAGLDYMAPLAADLRERGWATWSLEFRRLGQPGGGWPGTFLDAAAGVDHLRALSDEHPLDPGRVITLGHSSGGHLALWVAARHRIDESSVLYRPGPLACRGAVALGGIADLTAFHALPAPERGCADAVVELLGGLPEDVPDRLAAASPAELLPTGVPGLLMTGELDPDVPPAHGEGYVERAVRAGDRVRHVRVAGAGHFEVVSPGWERWEEVVGPLIAWIERVAGSG